MPKQDDLGLREYSDTKRQSIESLNDSKSRNEFFGSKPEAKLPKNFRSFAHNQSDSNEANILKNDFKISLKKLDFMIENLEQKKAAELGQELSNSDWKNALGTTKIDRSRPGNIRNGIYTDIIGRLNDGIRSTSPESKESHHEGNDDFSPKDLGGGNRDS